VFKKSSGKIYLKAPKDLEKMRNSGRIVFEALAELKAAVRPGVTTGELDTIAHLALVKRGAWPSFKNYHGYPASICASVNDEVVHGIPKRDRILRQGDIVSIDLGAYYKGFHGDSAITVAVGAVKEETQRLLDVTEAALWQGIEKAHVGAMLHDISRAIQEYVEGNGCSVVREMVGHGIGRQMHEEPQVPNYVPDDQPNCELREGMTLAIEPMVNAGGPEIEVLGDNWTVVTQDRGLSAHFEHTVAITRKGPWILTLPGTDK
jgi:methionyl aminopeptidase